MVRTRVFVSFDREHDADLGALLRAQAKRAGSTFDIVPHAHGASTHALSEERTRAEIQSADEVVIICGEHTHDSKSVAAELSMAREESKPYMLLWGRRERMCTKPDGAAASDAMYSWTREILESQMSLVLRNAKPMAVPENCKRGHS